MAFVQFKLEKTTDQTRRIFDKYAYSTPDTIADILVDGYFAESRFPSLAAKSLLFADCGDGFAICLFQEGSLELLFNSNVPYTAPVNIIENSGVWDGANMVYLDTDGGDLVVLLPPAADHPNTEIYFKRITNSTAIASLQAFAGDTFEDESVFTEFTMAVKNDYVKIKSDGVGVWRVLERRTFCGAALALDPPASFDITTSPTKLDSFTDITFTTRLRCEANVANSSVDVVSMQLDEGDFYDIRFSVSLEYANNSNVHVQVYCDGAPIPTLVASSAGEGPNDNTTLSSSQLLRLPMPCTLTLMIWGDTIQTSVINGLSFDAQRIGG